MFLRGITRPRRRGERQERSPSTDVETKPIPNRRYRIVVLGLPRSVLESVKTLYLPRNSAGSMSSCAAERKKKSNTFFGR